MTDHAQAFLQHILTKIGHKLETKILKTSFDNLNLRFQLKVKQIISN